MACKNGICKPSKQQKRAAKNAPVDSARTISGNKPPFKSSSLATVTPEQKKIFDALGSEGYNRLMSLLDEGAPQGIDFGPQLQGLLGGGQRSPYQGFPQSDINSLLGGVPPQLSQSFDFSPIREDALASFDQRTTPLIREKFAQMNAGRSSGREQALSQARQDLERGLGSQQAQFQQQSQRNLVDLFTNRQSNLTSLLKDFGGLTTQQGLGQLSSLTNLYNTGTGQQSNQYNTQLQTLLNMLNLSGRPQFENVVSSPGLSKGTKTLNWLTGLGGTLAAGAKAAAPFFI